MRCRASAKLNAICLRRFKSFLLKNTCPEAGPQVIQDKCFPLA